jgi:hypothetical protein
MAGLMIAAELTERCRVQLKQNFAEFFGIGIAGCETLSVNPSQRADEGASVFAADFAILAAVAVDLPCSCCSPVFRGDSILPSGSNGD